MEIIDDDNEYCKKIYLSLLKNQMFQLTPLTKSIKENNSSTKLKSKENKPKDIINQTNTGIDNRSIVKNLNESSFNMLTNKKTNTFWSNAIRSPDTKRQNDLFNQLELATSGKYRSLLNFDIDETESAIKYLQAKRIPKTSYKILDSPNLKDDFYLDLIDWSKRDCLAVGLEDSLYLWKGNSGKVELMKTLVGDEFTSVCWDNTGDRLVLGTNNGNIYACDINKPELPTSFTPHDDRIDKICTMNINGNIFTVGSKDKVILSYDLRSPRSVIMTMRGHLQEVCGLKWSFDDSKLASGGNDNQLIIWSVKKEKPEKKLGTHSSAVKAIDWSPHKYGYLLSGGGAQDRKLNLWNVNTMTLVNSVETCSQVCNVAYSKISKEFVSTHGYSDNLIMVWDANKMEIKATLKGHKDRVIYMSLGPDGQSIATGAGDESIRLWKVFIPDERQRSNSNLNINSINSELVR